MTESYPLQQLAQIGKCFVGFANKTEGFWIVWRIIWLSLKIVDGRKLWKSESVIQLFSAAVQVPIDIT